MKKLFFSLGVIVSLSVALAAPVFAGPLSGGLTKLNTANKNTGLSNDLEGTVGTVIKAVLAMVGTIFLGLTIYAGILWMTAAGNDEQVTKATGIIKAAIIGLFITMSAYAITFFIASRIGGDAETAGSGAGTPADARTVSPSDCYASGGTCGSQGCRGTTGTNNEYRFTGQSMGLCSASGGGVQLECCAVELVN